MLRDILTVFFIVAGCLLLWLNFRRQPRQIVLTKDDDDQTDVAHALPEQNESDDDSVNPLTTHPEKKDDQTNGKE